MVYLLCHEQNRPSRPGGGTATPKHDRGSGVTAETDA
jgi:hypothetical protein